MAVLFTAAARIKGDLYMEISKNSPIGIIDSGVGGLTVVKELQKILPNEDIIYTGDSKNCPYGNRASENIVELTKKMLNFLKSKNVKVVAVACNTISSLLEEYKNDYDFEIIGIISSAADYVVQKGIKSVGVLATSFTIKTQCYNKMIQSQDKAIEVIGQGSPILAALVDSGNFNQKEINTEICTQIDKILAVKNVENIILGCTHYPILEKNFKECYPNINFINPALEQANAVYNYINKLDILNENGGSFNIITSATPENYENISNMLNLKKPESISVAEF